MNLWDAEGYKETHTRGKIPGDENRSKLSQSAKTIENIALHLRTTLAKPHIYDWAYH